MAAFLSSHEAPRSEKLAFASKRRGRLERRGYFSMPYVAPAETARREPSHVRGTRKPLDSIQGLLLPRKARSFRLLLVLLDARGKELRVQTVHRVAGHGRA